MGNRIVGIDLGTTNSVIALVENGKPIVIKDKEGNSVIPSVVGITSSGELVVGHEALNQYVTNPRNTIRSIKRKMGSKEKVSMGDNEYSPAEISAIILRYLKRIAEDYIGEEINRAVITVPAYFSDIQRQATKDAGEIAGFKVERIINEPTASALAYGIDKQEEQNILVYDLGGGTFDISIIENIEDIIEVKASHGNNHLGGDDFDKKIEEYIIKNFEKDNPKIDLKKDIKAMAKLWEIAENAKKVLSKEPFTKLYAEYITKKNIFSALHLNMEFSRSEFENLIKNLLESTKDSIDIALKDAELSSEEIDKVLLVGGSTRIPYVWEIINSHLGKIPHTDINPDEAVALGAAVQAAIIEGINIDAVLVDVSPYSLGVEYAEIKGGRVIPGFYKSLIKRNATIPASASEVFYTLSPEQKSVEIKVYQGDYGIASMNNFVGSFMFENISESKDEDKCREIVVQFDYDIDGMIHVYAIDRKSERKEEGLTVSESQIKLTKAEKDKSREEIKKLEENIISVESEVVTPEKKKIYTMYEKCIKFREFLIVEKAEKKLLEEVEEIISQFLKAKDTGEVEQKFIDKINDLMYENDFIE